MSRIKILIFKDKKTAVKEVALLIVGGIICKRKFRLGLATGETMIPVYREVVKLYKRGEIDFAHVKTFDIDEYLNINYKNTFEYFLKKNLLSKVNVKKENQHFLKGGDDARRVCRDYDNKVKRERIDLQLLGIGKNGHIAFNEPGSSFRSRTRKTKLREETRQANKRFFRCLKDVPLEALTTGVGTILDSRKIILVAFGKEKARVVARALNHRPSISIPASALQKHRDVTFVLDKHAASLLASC